MHTNDLKQTTYISTEKVKPLKIWQGDVEILFVFFTRKNPNNSTYDLKYEALEKELGITTRRIVRSSAEYIPCIS